MTNVIRRAAALAGFLAVAVLLAAAVGTVASLGARAHWFLELFSHFRIQYLVLLVLAGVACLLLGRRRWAVGALIFAVPNVLVVAPYLPGVTGTTAVASSPGTDKVDVPVTLLAANLLYLRYDVFATRAYFQSRSADVVVLSEFTPRWRFKLKELERRYPHVTLRPQDNPWGIAVYSKFPMLEIEDLDLGDDRSANLRVVVQTPAGPLEVYAVHLASPSSAELALMRNTQLRLLARRIAEAGDVPRIVAGDFNLTPYSPYFGDLLRDASLVGARRPSGMNATWPTWRLPLWIPIDHCLVGGGVAEARVVNGPDIGSDHYPIECTIELPRPAGRST